jgi:hypothetical protein
MNFLRIFDYGLNRILVIGSFGRIRAADPRALEKWGSGV